jgi:enoyl-[acyl-carrier protein] reductase III
MAALVTGGTKGIGLAIAARFAAEGHPVVCNYAHDTEAAEAAVAQITADGGAATALRADIGTEDGVSELAAACQALSTDGPWHVVHAAVRAQRVAASELDATTLGDALAVNTLPLAHLVRAFQPLLDTGSTVTLVSSEGPRAVVAGYAAVAASKAAAETLVRYLAIELAPAGIRCNTVVSGPVLTDALRAVFPDADRWFDRLAARNPSGRAVTGEDIAHACWFLAGDGASMITGQTLTVDGGAGLG